MDDGHAPEIDHTTTLRANILRGFFDRSQTRSPAKSMPASLSTSRSPQQHSPFLDMIRSKRGFPVADQLPPQDAETQGDEVNRAEDEVSSERTHESSAVDTEVCFSFHPHFPPTHLFI